MLCWTPEHPLCDFRKLLAVSQRGSVQGGTALMEVATRIELRTYKSLSAPVSQSAGLQALGFLPQNPGCFH